RCAQPARLALALGIAVKTALENVSLEIRDSRARLVARNVDRPQMPPDSRQVGRVGDFLVTEELRPGAVRRVGEVLSRAFARSMPACGWLRGVLPEEGPAPVGVPEPDRHRLRPPRPRPSAAPPARGPPRAAR